MVDSGLGVSLADVERARERIAGMVEPTPLVRSPALSECVGGEVWLKLENLQATGSFKLRGAASKLLSLSAAERARGVVASSAGNHGLAVAEVARRLEVPATICVPVWADPVKRDAIARTGAELVVEGETFDEAFALSRRLEHERGLTYVHPFDDPAVVAGQGTIGLELVEQLPGLDAVATALSGGGLAAGVALAVKSVDADVRFIGVSAERAAVMAESVRAGHPLELPEEPTLASALAGGIDLDNRYTLAMVRALVDDLPRVSEDDIAWAMRFMLGVHHVLVEGGGAVGVAAALAGKLKGAGRVVAIVVSGGNVDPRTVLGLF